MPDTIGGTKVGGRVVKRPATKVSRAIILDNFSMFDPILGRSFVRRLADDRSVMTPFEYVTEHVEETKIVGKKRADRPGSVAAVRLVPSVVFQELCRLAVVATDCRARAAGEFPFRLCEESVALATKRIGRNTHPFVIDSRVIGKVAPLSRRYTLACAQPVAVGSGSIPRNLDHRTVRLGAVSVDIALFYRIPRVLACESLELLNCHLLRRDREAARQSCQALDFIDGIALGLVRGRPFQIRDRAAHDRISLSVAVQEPAPAGSSPLPAQLGFDVLDPLVLSPSFERPLCRGVKASVGIRFERDRPEW